MPGINSYGQLWLDLLLSSSSSDYKLWSAKYFRVHKITRVHPSIRVPRRSRIVNFSTLVVIFKLNCHTAYRGGGYECLFAGCCWPRDDASIYLGYRLVTFICLHYIPGISAALLLSTSSRVQVDGDYAAILRYIKESYDPVLPVNLIRIRRPFIAWIARGAGCGRV